MKTLQCKGWTTALVLTLSGCAGELDNAQNYGTRAPVADASVARTAQAGRTSAADAGAGRVPQAGRAGESAIKPAMNMNSNTNTSMNMATPTDNSNDDAGAGESNPTQMPSASASCDFPGLMKDKCGNATCHGAPGSATGLDLTTAMLAARVAGRMGTGACSDKLLVDKDDPRQSKLYLKVSGTTCGSQMPLGGMLTQSEQACVLTWIEKL